MRVFLSLTGIVVGGLLIALGMARIDTVQILLGFIILPAAVLAGLTGTRQPVSSELPPERPRY